MADYELRGWAFEITLGVPLDQITMADAVEAEDDVLAVALLDHCRAALPDGALQLAATLLGHNVRTVRGVPPAPYAA
jgi:hypothetical protein